MIGAGRGGSEAASSHGPATERCRARSSPLRRTRTVLPGHRPPTVTSPGQMAGTVAHGSHPGHGSTSPRTSATAGDSGAAPQAGSPGSAETSARSLPMPASEARNESDSSPETARVTPSSSGEPRDAQLLTVSGSSARRHDPARPGRRAIDDLPGLEEDGEGAALPLGIEDGAPVRREREARQDRRVRRLGRERRCRAQDDAPPAVLDGDARGDHRATRETALELRLLLQRPQILAPTEPELPPAGEARRIDRPAEDELHDHLVRSHHPRWRGRDDAHARRRRGRRASEHGRHRECREAPHGAVSP